MNRELDKKDKEMEGKNCSLHIYRKGGRVDVYKKAPINMDVAVGDPLSVIKMEIRDEEDNLIASWKP